MRIIFIFLLTSIVFACNSSDTTLLDRAEAAEKNPVKKGRYDCYYLDAGGRRLAPELFMLSHNLYQVNDSVGHYKYHAKNSEVEWLDGPFHKPAQAWGGFYTPNGLTTIADSSGLKSMIRIEAQLANSVGRWPIVMQCNCTELE